MNDPYSLVITDEEKNDALRRIEADIAEWYRRNPDEAPRAAAATKETACRP